MAIWSTLYSIEFYWVVRYPALFLMVAFSVHHNNILWVSVLILYKVCVRCMATLFTIDEITIRVHSVCRPTAEQLAAQWVARGGAAITLNRVYSNKVSCWSFLRGGVSALCAVRYIKWLLLSNKERTSCGSIMK